MIEIEGWKAGITAIETHLRWEPLTVASIAIVIPYGESRQDVSEIEAWATLTVRLRDGPPPVALSLSHQLGKAPTIEDLPARVEQFRVDEQIITSIAGALQALAGSEDAGKYRVADKLAGLAGLLGGGTRCESEACNLTGEAIRLALEWLEEATIKLPAHTRAAINLYTSLMPIEGSLLVGPKIILEALGLQHLAHKTPSARLQLGGTIIPLTHTQLTENIVKARLEANRIIAVNTANSILRKYNIPLITT